MRRGFGAVLVVAGALSGVACAQGGGSGGGSGSASAAPASAGAGTAGPSSPSTPSAPAPAAGNGSGFQLCGGNGFAAPAPEPFRHTLMSWLAASLPPEHSAQDVILLPGSTGDVPGKFAYGVINKDLEDEDVRVFLDACQAGWTPLGRVTTNGDGRTAQPLDTAALALGAGAYDLRQAVVGDASVASSRLHVLPPNTQIVVFDIDGTLTTSDTELFIDIFDEYFVPLRNGYTPAAYAGAAAVTQAYAAKGYVIVYLTGRPYWLTRITRDWLDQLGFAPGSLHVANSNGEAWPSESGVGDMKRDYLRHLLSFGYAIEYAYGNATTDIYAYREAGIPTSRTFTIGRHAGEDGTQPLLGDYLNHIPVLATHPAANQPF